MFNVQKRIISSGSSGATFSTDRTNSLNDTVETFEYTTLGYSIIKSLNGTSPLN